jgi:hypothetical protein
MSSDNASTCLTEAASFRLAAIDMCAIHKRYARTLSTFIKDLDTFGLIDPRQAGAVDELLRRLDQFLVDKVKQVAKAGV